MVTAAGGAAQHDARHRRRSAARRWRAPRFHVAATLNGKRATPVTGAFAPARYFAMSDDEKLAAPSFETMDAGSAVRRRIDVVRRPRIVPAPLEYDAIVLNPLPTPTKRCHAGPVGGWERPERSGDARGCDAARADAYRQTAPRRSAHHHAAAAAATAHCCRSSPTTTRARRVLGATGRGGARAGAARGRARFRNTQSCPPLTRGAAVGDRAVVGGAARARRSRRHDLDGLSRRARRR